MRHVNNPGLMLRAN